MHRDALDASAALDHGPLQSLRSADPARSDRDLAL